MGFFKKLVGSAAVIGAAVGGISYLKKCKEEKYTEDDIFEDFDDEKIFDIKTNSNKNGTQKITITFNSNKAKSMANNAADKVLEAADSAKGKIVDAVGEEKYDSAVKKVTDAATFAKDKAIVGLQCNDIFESLYPKVKVRFDKQYQNLNQNFYQRNITLSFTYKFNGFKDRTPKEVDTSRYGVN